MGKNQTRVIVDTNVLVSGVIFSGKPRKIVEMISKKNIRAVISPTLISELLEVLSKKFEFGADDINLVEKRIKKEFEAVIPQKNIDVVRDIDDNRVLEAAVEGNCDYVVTGDKDLLDLKKYKNIFILTPADFLARI